MNKQFLSNSGGLAVPANENSPLTLESLRVVASADFRMASFRGKCNPIKWNEAGPEPTLEEALADPIVRLVMARDGVSDEDILKAADLSGLL